MKVVYALLALAMLAISVAALVFAGIAASKSQWDEASFWLLLDVTITLASLSMRVGKA